MSMMTPGRPNESYGLGSGPPVPEIKTVFKLYPNPNAGDLFIAVEGNGDYQGEQYGPSGGNYFVDLVDISGKVVYPRVWLNGSHNHLDISMLDGGLYIARVFRDDRLVHTARVILMK